MNSLKQAIEQAGGNSVVAEKLGVSSQRLSNWIDRGVPTDQCAALEAAVGGLFTRQQLRPDEWQRIWPELTRPATPPEPPTPAPAAASVTIPAHIAARGIAAADELDLVERRTRSVDTPYARRVCDRAALAAAKEGV